MNRKKILFLIVVLFSLGFLSITRKTFEEDKILSYIVDPKSQDVKLFWKDDAGNIFKSIHNLKTYIEKRGLQLVFAVNGGMFKSDYSPQGLFIQEQKILSPLDTSSGKGNFYLKPNGAFYITTDNKPFILTTERFFNNGKIKYATQSGPMLVIDGKIHSAFKQGSKNLNTRNGVGILPNGKVVFAMSKEEINFYDFASFFVHLGCQNALYLDGYVSRTYLPEKNWTQLDGNFGVIIGVTK